jgi:hypothetical protein
MIFTLILIKISQIMKRISSLMLVMLCFNSLFAQDGPKVVVFNQSSDEDQTVMTAKNLFKLSLLEAFSGDISLYYERVLSENAAVELGIGATIDDYLGSIVYADDPYTTSIDGSTSLIGRSFALGFRYYPFKASDEFYFAPEFKYRFYHSQTNYGSVSAPNLLESSKNFTNFRISVGYVYYFDDNIFIDYYAGVGLANFHYRGYNSVYDGNTGLTNYVAFDQTRPRPWLSLGVKFGFGL